MQPASFCVTASCHLVLLAAPAPHKPSCEAQGEAEGQVRKLTRDPGKRLFATGHDTDWGFGAKNSKSSPKQVRGEQRSEEEGRGDAVRGGGEQGLFSGGCSSGPGTAQRQR